MGERACGVKSRETYHGEGRAKRRAGRRGGEGVRSEEQRDEMGEFV